MVAKKAAKAKEQTVKRTIVKINMDGLEKAIHSVSAAIERPGADPYLSCAALVLAAVRDGIKIKLVNDISTELKKFDILNLECDGLTRVLSYRLTELRMKHKVMVGHFEYSGNKAVPIHWWVKLADGRTVDYRAKMWAGDVKEVPHGVFMEADYPAMKYVGEPHDIEVSRKMYLLLVDSGAPIPPVAPKPPAAEPTPAVEAKPA